MLTAPVNPALYDHSRLAVCSLRAILLTAAAHPHHCRPRGMEATQWELRKEARTSPGFGRSGCSRRCLGAIIVDPNMDGHTHPKGTASDTLDRIRRGGRWEERGVGA